MKTAIAAEQALELLADRSGRQLNKLGAERRASFLTQAERYFPALFDGLYELYGSNWDFFLQLEAIFHSLISSYSERPASLLELDRQRLDNPQWYQGQHMIGAMLYVDRFAGDLKGLMNRLDYLEDLGVTYLHLMPLFDSPAGENDGGYAISSYRKVSPALGTMEELARLAEELRKRGISLVLDFVFNHSSNEHIWAKKARKGDPEYRDYYYIFPDKIEMDSYNRHLRDIFPDVRSGSFTWDDDLEAWVWTTFNSFQWDLNYSNPRVFRSMMEEMLYIANQGAEILRLDALAFVWKERGTSCENLPEAHSLIRCFRAAGNIAAPALAFKSEAIVHPDEVVRYIHKDECELSYNPLLMALLWESLATRKSSLLEHSLQKRFAIDPSCSWVNYVRCHDDIGWTFADEDAGELWINGHDHRHFLNEFYTDRFPGSFSRGVPFGFNPETGDCRISGTCASLSGIEAGLESTEERDPAGPSLARGATPLQLGFRRHLMLHGVLLSISGIPLIYLGDELAQLNWYDYRNKIQFREDSRWIHRGLFDWSLTEKLAAADKNDPSTPVTMENYHTRSYAAIRKMIRTRKEHKAFTESKTEILSSPNPQLFIFIVGNRNERILVISNFSEEAQTLDMNLLRINGFWPDWECIYHNCGTAPASSAISSNELTLDPLQQLWIERIP